LDASPLETIAQKGRAVGSLQSAHKRFVIAMREPWQLPDDKIELPVPEPIQGNPPTLNIFSTLLPPIMMGVVVYIYSRMSPEADIRLMILMPMMSLAFPIGNLVNYFFQKKDFKKKLAIREQNYRKALNKMREKLDELAHQQRSILEREYPVLPKLALLAIGQSSRRRLWWRRPSDSDFLSLRMGTGLDLPSFSVSLPRINDQNEPLAPLAAAFVTEYREISKIPSLMNLAQAGSIAIAGKSGSGEFSLARRMIMDVILNHSPQDVQVVVLADTREARERWEWLKWAPHTRAIKQGETLRRLAFTPAAIDKCLEYLDSEFNQRFNAEPGSKKRRSEPKAAIVVILDDEGSLRQSGDVKQLAADGHEVGIYTIFAGGKHWPRECRARIDVTDNEFVYMETWTGEKNGRRVKGSIDPASLADCERFARGISGLELSSGKGDSSLPESVRLFELLDAPLLSPELVKQNWQRLRSDDEFLRFSFGFRPGRKGLEEVELNLLPEDLGGIGAYHTILVGTTGSGKSEFMKSLVLSAAFRYSPEHLNFFVLDFKGGAAFTVLKDLPHVVGVVTNLGPQLVERGLSAMEAEIERRQKMFAEAGVQNIWGYNARQAGRTMPQLLLLLDEFARGIEEFPRLPDMLDRLVRQGRSLGMYLLLANQDVNSAVDKLLNNVGWRIALKVARQEEMHIVEDRMLPIARRAGQGYLKSSISDAVEFQAAYSGFPVQEAQVEEVLEAFKIFQVENDGRWQLIHSSARQSKAEEVKRNIPIEQDQLVSVMKTTALEIEPARPIYLDPLDEQISLEHVFEESALQRVFADDWSVESAGRNRMFAPVGFLDSPKECLQEEMEIDFEGQDGHLWIVGAPGSGKAMTVETILFSLALTHTPEEVWFYILEYGAGQLLKFESLPHTGAVLRSTDPEERLDKLLNFLDEEMDRRTAQTGSDLSSAPKGPAIFLVINNFAEMRSNYADHADRISRYARDGKAVGLHLIITTNRRIELGRLLIARRIVLRLANRDEYMDAVGKSMPLPAINAEGRGLWVVDQRIVECQIAQPKIYYENKTAYEDSRMIFNEMRKKWKGTGPRIIRVLPSSIPLEELLDQTLARNLIGLPIPVGLSFETQELICPQLLKEFPRWLVLGPPRSGKSNFLACVCQSILAQEHAEWKIYYFSLRRSPLEGVDTEQIQVIKTVDTAIQIFNEISAVAEKPADQAEETGKTLLLIDDLGGAFEPGKDALVTALNNMALKTATRENIFVIAAGMADELRSSQMSSMFVRGLKQGRTGVILSKDSNDMDWFGGQIPLQYRRMDLPTGRGFWITGGKATYLQTPLIGNFESEEE
jgi:S-DNA-T family DNA segregation ATPase FtsK/SpoIIIE